MKKKAIIAILPLMFVAACSFYSVLSEIGSTITKFAPLLPLVEVAACAVPNSACSAVSSFVNTATPFATGVGSAFTAWSTASASAQPGKLSQVIVAVQTWQGQLKNGLSIPGLSASATAVLESELNASADLLTSLEAALQAGGTTQALANVINEATPLDAEQAPVLAMWTPVRMVRAPRTYKLKNGAVIHTWLHHKAIVIEQLKKKSGSALQDKANSAVAAAISKL
jgi:hypothetical protein